MKPGPLDPARRSVLAGCAGIFALALGTTGALGQAAEAVDHTALRVCADPANLPFSNKAGEGFENKIAELLARDLGVPVRYTWYPQATGFVRQTLMARRCDLVVGISLGFELLQNSNPYYRSSYALVYRRDTGLDVNSLDDPVLKQMRLGVIAGTPPASIMARRGLLAQVRPYQLVADTRFHNPSKQMVDDVAAGTIDLGVLWGPIAGYHAREHHPKLAIVPLVSRPGEVKMDYRITMGLRFNEPDWKHRINALIKKHQAAINDVLFDYGVPLLDKQGRPITR